ncbi:hypothetical protein BDP67DRAFT_271271 [Colletotrichum lupini]|nr:hypothetical protein BDP67DRAFT_271271 [Colletotrichum lupini]
MKPTDEGGRKGDGCGGAAFWSGRPAVKGGDGAKQERGGGNGERRRWDLDKCFCSFTATLCRYQTALDLRRVVFEIGSVDKREGGKGKEEEGGIGGEQAGGGRILHIKDKTRSRVLWFAPSCCLSFFSCPFSLSASGWLLKQHTSLQTKHCVCVCVFVFWYYVFWAAFAKPLFFYIYPISMGTFFFIFFIIVRVVVEVVAVVVCPPPPSPSFSENWIHLNVGSAFSVLVVMAGSGSWWFHLERFEGGKCSFVCELMARSISRVRLFSVFVLSGGDTKRGD